MYATSEEAKSSTFGDVINFWIFGYVIIVIGVIALLYYLRYELVFFADAF